MNHNQVFGITVRELRILKNKSQETLGFDAGLDRTYISLLERGQRSPTLDTIMTLCASLDVSLSQLALMIESILVNAHD